MSCKEGGAGPSPSFPLLSPPPSPFFLPSALLLSCTLDMTDSQIHSGVARFVSWWLDPRPAGPSRMVPTLVGSGIGDGGGRASGLHPVGLLGGPCSAAQRHDPAANSAWRRRSSPAPVMKLRRAGTDLWQEPSPGAAGLALWGCRGGALASHSIAVSQSALASRLVRRSSESTGSVQRCIYDAAVAWPMEVFSGTEYFDSEHTDYNRKSFHQY